MTPERDFTPHPVASQPPSPSRGEGYPVHFADQGANSGFAEGEEPFSPAEVNGDGSHAANSEMVGETADGTGTPSPLEGEGARRAGEGSFPRARMEWRTNSTQRLRGFARSMCSNATDAERRLWTLVRNRRFIDYKFRRQVPIGRYIVDLMCPSAMLIVEIDGFQHAGSPRDAVRDAWLAQQGYRVLRIWNNDLTHNRNGVLDAIWHALQERRP